MQQQFKSNDDMASFVFDLKNKNYDVRYHTNSDNQMKTIFFIHDHGIQELRRLPECIVVDATYKTNIHKMVLLNFVVASTVSSREKPHQLATIPVAAAWMDRETADNYSWVLQQLRDIVWSPKKHWIWYGIRATKCICYRQWCKLEKRNFHCFSRVSEPFVLFAHRGKF